MSRQAYFRKSGYPFGGVPIVSFGGMFRVAILGELRTCMHSACDILRTSFTSSGLGSVV